VREPKLLSQQWHAYYSARRVTNVAQDCHDRRGFVIPQRLAVIRALLALENHPYAEDIYSAVRETLPHGPLDFGSHQSEGVRATRPRAGSFADDVGPKNQG
jgi:hypothetical protein